jgi:hypothetical protein
MAEEQKPSDESPATPDAAPAAPPSPRPRANVWIALAVVLVAVGFLAMNRRHRHGPYNPPRRQVAPAVDGGRAAPTAPVVEGIPRVEAPSGSPVFNLLAPLRPGATLGNATVERITDVIDGRILVTFRVDSEVGTYGIMLYTAQASDLLHAGRYVIYVHGSAPSRALNEVGNSLVELLSRHQSLPVPPGLRAIDLRPH